ncbi:MAG TPA: hypothetical protein VK530_03595 [Candidatus Acidoferrum sp.]|nr:hypothetical protein [Candidatus Acidoferrum sp.]
MVFSQAAFLPQGGEMEISGPLSGDQTAPAVAISPTGGWLVWQDPFIDGKGFGIGARKLDENFNPVGGALRVNKTIVGDQEKPRVASLNGGGAAVVWQGGKLGFQNIYVRFLNPDGTAINNSDILVNPPAGAGSYRVTTNWPVVRNNRVRIRTQRIKETFKRHLERTAGAVVATLSDGTVVVAYASGRKVSNTTQIMTERVKVRGPRSITNSVLVNVPSQSDTMQDIYFQRFTAAGEKIGSELRANQFLPFNQSAPTIAARSDGTFLMAWSSEQQRTGDVGDSALGQVVGGQIHGRGLLAQIDIVARVFSNDGTPVGDEFVVNDGDRPCSNPSAAASVGGGFTIAWTQKDAAQASLEIYARAYSPAGSPITAGFRVNNHSYGDQHAPQISAVPAGQLVVWTSLAQDGSREGIFGRWLNDGTIATSEFPVNTTTISRQFHPTVAGSANNRALVIWSSFQSDGGFDLFGQRYNAQ